MEELSRGVPVVGTVDYDVSFERDGGLWQECLVMTLADGVVVAVPESRVIATISDLVDAAYRLFPGLLFGVELRVDGVVHPRAM